MAQDIKSVVVVFTLESGRNVRMECGSLAEAKEEVRLAENHGVSAQMFDADTDTEITG